jgi:hypothetical protein
MGLKIKARPTKRNILFFMRAELDRNSIIFSQEVKVFRAFSIT